MVWEFIQASFLLGIPLGIFSFFLLSWSLKADEHDAAANPDGLKSFLKAAQKRPKKERKSANAIHSKWLKFGGGFYGCMAAFTYFYIEIKEIYSFLVNFIGLEKWFDSLGLNLLINFFINSIMNFVKAAIWFTYWPGETGADNPWLWLIAAYLGYWLGCKAAWNHGAGLLELPAFLNMRKGKPGNQA